MGNENSSRGPAAAAKPASFLARAIFDLLPDRMYRVFVLPGELVFIKVGGQRVLGDGGRHALRRELGLLGWLIGRSVTKRQQETLARNVSASDRSDPKSQLAAHKHNFLATRLHVLETSIEPPGFQTHGGNFGIWKVLLRDKKRLRLQFETIEDMRTALELLPPFFHPRLKVNVAWNDKRQVYVKRT